MSASDMQKRAAYLAGKLAARTGRPVTACPYDPTGQQLLTTWFVRGWRSTAAGM
jgi:hypothetical protein